MKLKGEILSMLRKFQLICATGLGLGYLPGPTGTWGSVLGIIIVYFCSSIPVLNYLFFAIAFTFFSIWVASAAEESFQTKDSKKIVIDEIAGIIITFVGVVPMTWVGYLIGFVLFRFFDILKPFPIRLIDKKLPGGLGVVLDDALAGVFAEIVLRLIVQWGGFAL